MAASVETGALIDGKYRVERAIGKGSMGTVFAVRHEQLGERFAIKIMRDTPDAVLRERFAREARAAATLRSEHVMRVFDVDVLPGGEPFMVMELLEGRDLNALIEAEGRRPVGEAVTFIMQACEGLAAAHARGMVHRDIKPANLFLAVQPGGRRIIKLLDFGITKTLGDGAHKMLTGTGDILGSPHFMAPEQVIPSRNVDARADIWSLGACLFELLSAEVPFDAPSLDEHFDAVVCGPPRSLAALCPTLPSALVSAVDRCLQKDPDHRYRNVGELAADLAPFAPDGSRSLERIGAHLLVAAKTEPDLAQASTIAVSPVAGKTLRWWLVVAAASLGIAVLVVVVLVAYGAGKRAAEKKQVDDDDEPVRAPTASARRSYVNGTQDDNLTQSEHDAITDFLTRAQTDIDAKNYLGAVALAERALAISNPGGGERQSDLFSPLTARAHKLQGDAYALASLDLVRSDPIDRRYYDLALTAYGAARTWDIHDRACAGGGFARMQLDHANEWIKHPGTVTAARETLEPLGNFFHYYATTAVFSQACKLEVASMQARFLSLQNRAR